MSKLQPVSTTTRPYPAGSFFTHEATEKGALEFTSAWPVVQAKTGKLGVRVIEMTVPNETLATLRSEKLIRTGWPAGLLGSPRETVFLPGALDLLNDTATFKLIEPLF